MKTKLTVIALLLLLLPASASFWMNYAHGYGGHEQALNFAMLIVTPLTLAMLLASVWTVIASLVSVVRHRPVGFVVLKIGIVVSLALTFILPSYVAKPMRRAGALARVSALGGEHFLSALREEAAILWKQAEREQQANFLVTNLPPVFAQAGVGIAHFQVIGNGQYRLDAITSGRPHPGGWIVTSGSEVQESSPTAVKVAENIYRY
jgi:hypothetical protein